MSDKTNDDYGVFKYRVAKLEEMIEPLVDLVNNLDKKISLLTQKIVIATILLGSLFQGVGVWYSVHGSKSSSFTDDDKQKYYESIISDSEKIKELEKELYQLRNKK